MKCPRCYADVVAYVFGSSVSLVCSATVGRREHHTLPSEATSRIVRRLAESATAALEKLP